jgi:hypothetical protein
MCVCWCIVHVYEDVGGVGCVWGVWGARRVWWRWCNARKREHSSVYLVKKTKYVCIVCILCCMCCMSCVCVCTFVLYVIVVCCMLCVVVCLCVWSCKCLQLDGVILLDVTWKNESEIMCVCVLMYCARVCVSTRGCVYVCVCVCVYVCMFGPP